MTRIVDVAIIGGGVMGSAIACFLAADPAFPGRVVVIERDPTYQRASSALSASSIRQQFSTPENIRMSRFGFAYLRDIDRHLRVDGADPAVSPDIGLTERGYLYLAAPVFERAVREIHATQVAEGADVELLDLDQLGARFPWLSVEGVAVGSLGRAGEGWFDGYALTMAFRRKAMSLGVEYIVAEAVGMHTRDGRVTAVHLDDASVIAPSVVVDAAGPWAARVAAMAGIALPVEARRRCVFVFEAADPPATPPLVIDPSGAWFRTEGGAFIGAISPTADDDPADLPLEVDERLWEGRLWPALAARVPAFDRVRRTGAWAGYYEINTFDRNAILGPHPELANLLFAAGFSGHGIQHAPAVGRAIAELIVHGGYRTLDLSVFGYERIAAGRPIVERNVIG
jgi:FAD-dependent oxidoreductase domain-containing protein 1